jgi:hypothetical protein
MRTELRALKIEQRYRPDHADVLIRFHLGVITGRRKAPNSFAEARMDRPSNDKGADNVDEVYEDPSCDFTSCIAGSDVGNREWRRRLKRRAYDETELLR